MSDTQPPADTTDPSAPSPINAGGGTGNTPYGPPNPNANNDPWGGLLSNAANIAQQQLAGQPLEQVDPRTFYLRGGPRGPIEEQGAEVTDWGKSNPPPPPPGYDFQASDPTELPNWDKLSGLERWVYQGLPGYNGPLADQLKKWDASWYGHSVDTGVLPAAAFGMVGGGIPGAAIGALFGTAMLGVGKVFGQQAAANVGSALFAPFEAANRVAGLGSQIQEAVQSGTLDQLNSQLKAAWYAGSLQADVAPNSGFQIDNSNGQLHAVIKDNQLGGATTLVQARQRIAELMAAGVNPHDALMQTRAEWYGKLGALAVRAQTNNFIASLLVNPIEPIMGTLRPVERIQATRTVLAGMEAAPEAVAELQKGVTTAEAASKAAQEAGDGTKIQAANQALQQAQDALSRAQSTNLTWGQQKLVQLLGLGDKARGADVIMGLSGGVPGEGNALSAKWNPFALTPEARVSEYMTILNDNLGSYHVAANTDAAGKFDPEGFVRGIQRVADGASDPRMGNMLTTLEGRSVKTAVGAFADRANEMLTAWQQTGNLERPLLENIAAVMGTTPEEIMARLGDDDPGQAALLGQYNERVAQTPGAQQALTQLLANNNLQALDGGTLARVYHVLKDVPYTDQQFLAKAVNELSDHAAQQALVQFGVKQSGVIRRIAEMTKAAESLAHFRVNPAYPIRMFITDTMTQLARGTFGTMSNGEINAFWDTLGFEPARLYQSAGYTGPEDFASADAAKAEAGPLVQAQSDAQKAIYKTTNGTNDAVQKVTRMLGSIKPPDILNAQSWARDITAMASKRSYTTGYIRFMDSAMQKAVGHMVDYYPADAAIMGKDLTRTFENSLYSVRQEAHLDAMLDHPNLNLTMGNVLDKARADSGLKIDQVISTEFQHQIEPILQQAAATGDKAAMETAFKQVSQMVNDHLDSTLESTVATMRDEAFAQTTAEKTGAGPKLWAQANDEIISAHIKHTMDQAYLQEQLSGLKGPEATSAWTSMRENDSAFFDRAWQRAEARVNGFAEAAKAAGLSGGDEMLAQFQSWKGDSQKFISDRNDLWNAYWDAKGKGATPPVPYDQILVKVDNSYMSLIERERAYQQSMDAGISKMLPPEEQPSYLAWRDRVATLRTADKQAVLEFRRSIRGLRGPALEGAYQQFTQERLGRLGQLQYENSAGQAMMQGVPEAQARYTQSVATAQQEMDALNQLIPAKMDGTPLAPEQQAVVDAVVQKYATPQEAEQLRAVQRQIAAVNANPPVRPTAEGVKMQEQAALKSANVNVGGKRLDGISPDVLAANPELAQQLSEVKPPAEQAADLQRQYDAAKAEVKRLRGAQAVEKASGSNVGEANQAYADAQRKARALAMQLSNAKKAAAALQIPMEVDPEKLAAQLDLHLSEQTQIEQSVWKRISPAADEHAVANTPAGGVPGKDLADNTSLPDQFKNVFSSLADGIKKAGADKIDEYVARIAAGEDPAKIKQGLPQSMIQAIDEKLSVGATPSENTPAVAGAEAPQQPPEQAQPPTLPQQPAAPIQPAQATPPATTSALPDLSAVVKPQLYQHTGIDELWYTRGQQALDAIKRAAMGLADQPPLTMADIPAEAQAGARGMIEKAYGDLADARYASMRFGEYTRDSALLNYNRRYNFDSWLSNIFPYEFWTTHSAFNWAIHSIDRPAMLATYLRTKQFLDTAYKPEQGFPSRLQGTLRVNLPFMPDFMGKTMFIDPFKLGLPFEGWQSPFDRYAAQEQTDLGAAERQLQALFNDGKITQPDMMDALKNHAGPTWDRAVGQARLNDTQGSQNYMDLLTSLMPAHLPLLYAYDALNGKNPLQAYGDRGPVLPITRTLGGVLATLGVDPSSPANPEAAIRKQLGLHPFGKWDDYYAERQLTDELAMSKISVEDARQAMLTHQGPAWDAAVKKAGIEMGGGSPIGALAAMAGVPVKGYPPGEEYLRSLKDDYQAAWAKYDQGDTHAVSDFNAAHPGYEERLALFKTPEDRLHQFTQDQFWNTWFNLPTLTRDELKNQLSGDFAKMVTTNAPGEKTSPEVASFRRNVSTDQMAVWLKLMGADPVGSLDTKPALQDTGQDTGLKLNLATPEIAQRAQVFYNMRNTQFPGWYDQQKAYYAIPEGQMVNLGARNDTAYQDYIQRRDAQFGSDITALTAQYFALPAGSAQRRAMYRANPKIGAYESFRANEKASNPNFSQAVGFNDTEKTHSISARAQYVQQHPVLQAYFGWKGDFLKRNADLAPYLQDQTKGGTVAAPPKPAMQTMPQYSRQEWQSTLGWNLYNLVQDTNHDPRSFPLSPVAEAELRKKAAALGYTGPLDQLAKAIGAAQ